MNETMVKLLEVLVNVITIVVSFILGQKTSKYDYDSLFAETITKNRMEWINVWRENLSNMLAIADIFHNENITNGQNIKKKNKKKKNKKCKNNNSSQTSEKSQEYIRMKKEYNKSKYMILSRLNLTEVKHKLLMKSIMKFDYSPENKNYTPEREFILDLAREILKPEWERLKLEAKGEKR